MAATASSGAVRTIDAARRDMYRRQILDAAEVEFGRNGFDNTKVTAIAATAGLSLATVYKHFGGKAEIWDRLHNERMTELLDRVDAEGHGADGALDRILAGVTSVAGYLTEHPTYLDMNLWAGAGWASSDHAGIGAQRTVWSAGIDTLAGGIDNAVALEEIPPIDGVVAAGLIVSSIQVWLAAWTKEGRRTDPAPLIDAMVGRLRWTLAGPNAERRPPRGELAPTAGFEPATHGLGNEARTQRDR